MANCSEKPVRPEIDRFAALSLLGKARSIVHRRRTAYADRIDACHACGACVGACPENAIKLVAVR